MNRLLVHGLLTLVVLTLFGAGTFLLIELKQEPEKTSPTRMDPSVKVVAVKSALVPVEIQAHGTVRARTNTQLTSRVSGLITDVSEHFEEGGFFEQGEVLLRIDPIAYQTQVANAQAQLATARLQLATEEAAAKRAQRDWQRLKSSEPSSELAAREPQLAKAQADVAAAEAALASAEYDLQHTEVRAPYAGRIRSKMVDVGQSVTALGSVLADIYAIDSFEVVLPLPQEDAWFLEMPEGKASPEMTVTLLGDVGAGAEATWQGVMDRSSGIVDENNRFVRIMVRVEDPYGLQGGAITMAPTLKLGQFVRATIPGRAVEDAFEVPREAILPGDFVLVIKPKAGNLADAVMERRPVTMIRKESNRVIVTEGLSDGDYVSVTRLQFYADGMGVCASLWTEREQDEPGKLIEQVVP